ncbi:MAG: nitrilase-related carbon-nitrogen hydrolase, partial [Pseudomonadota bacterium]
MAADTLREALVQLSVSDDPAANLPVTLDLVRQAAASGARLVCTPEVTNLLTGDPDYRAEVLCTEAEDPTLAALRALATETGIWLSIGSLALRLEGEGRAANRQFLVAPDGSIAARYDKIHMF